MCERRTPMSLAADSMEPTMSSDSTAMRAVMTSAQPTAPHSPSTGGVSSSSSSSCFSNSERCVNS